MNILEAAREYLDNIDNGAEYFYQESRSREQIKLTESGCVKTQYSDKDGGHFGIVLYDRYNLLATDWRVHYAELKLKPCEHCKNQDPELRPKLANRFDIICRVCQKCTYAYETKQEAITAWNRRDGGEK